MAKHAWNSHCPIKWEEASVLDNARNSPDLMIKEAIHIQTTPMDRLINRGKVLKSLAAGLLPSVLLHRNGFEQLSSDLLALGVNL